jgi:DNA helicase INO80
MLTGSPVQNSISELWSLLSFLMPQLLPTNTKEWFTKAESPQEKIKTILHPFMLRYNYAAL